MTRASGHTRVALVTPRFRPDVGGLEGYVGRVAAVLQEAGRYDVTVVTTGASRRVTREVWHGIPVIRLGTWLTVSNTRLNPLWWERLRWLLDRLDVDVVNAHAPTPGLADLAALTAPAPVVLTYHAGSLVKGGHPVDVGDGDDVPALRRLAEGLGLAESVDWHGAVAQDALPRFYRRAAVTVLPSTTEPESFGMTLVEAMACGCPVVGSRVGGIPFVVRDGVDGLLAEPGDAASLAAALAAVLTDPARAAALGVAGRQAAEQRWDWRHLAERTVGVLDQALGHDTRTVNA